MCSCNDDNAYYPFTNSSTSPDNSFFASTLVSLLTRTFLGYSLPKARQRMRIFLLIVLASVFINRQMLGIVLPMPQRNSLASWYRQRLWGMIRSMICCLRHARHKPSSPLTSCIFSCMIISVQTVSYITHKAIQRKKVKIWLKMIFRDGAIRIMCMILS